MPDNESHRPTAPRPYLELASGGGVWLRERGVPLRPAQRQRAPKQLLAQAVHIDTGLAPGAAVAPGRQFSSP
jgi:hypothetical protein